MSQLLLGRSGSVDPSLAIKELSARLKAAQDKQRTLKESLEVETALLKSAEEEIHRSFENESESDRQHLEITKALELPRSDVDGVLFRLAKTFSVLAHFLSSCDSMPSKLVAKDRQTID